MGEIPAIADIRPLNWHVRFVPILLQKSKIDGWQFSREKAKQVEIAD
jgi:hypothetical protein